MLRWKLLPVAALAGIGAVASASAANAAVGAFVTEALNLRAGPGFDYPAVVVMGAGDPVQIYGCLDGWTWCDIAWRGNRGWAAGRYLQVVYETRRVPVYEYGVRLGIPFVVFNINVYWRQHYRHRPFFNELPRYAGREHGPRPPFTPPRGPGREGPPGGPGPHPGAGPGAGTGGPGPGPGAGAPPRGGNQPPFTPRPGRPGPGAGGPPQGGGGAGNPPSVGGGPQIPGPSVGGPPRGRGGNAPSLSAGPRGPGPGEGGGRRPERH